MTSTVSPVVPLQPYPPDDLALDELFQACVTSLTGIPGNLVLPRWQPTEPVSPSAQSVTTNWCALGVTVATPNDNGGLNVDPLNPLQSTYTRHEDIEVLASFYGPAAKTNAALLRDGLQVDWNTEVLAQSQIRFVDSGAIRTLPELLNSQWIRRVDMPIRFRRKVTRTYLVPSLAIGQVVLNADTGAGILIDPISVPVGTPVIP